MCEYQSLAEVPGHAWGLVVTLVCLQIATQLCVSNFTTRQLPRSMYYTHYITVSTIESEAVKRDCFAQTPPANHTQEGAVIYGSLT